MRFLFIDGWADYSNIFNDYRDNSTNSVFLLYASAFKKINKDTFYINASEKDFNKEKLYKFIEEKKIEVAIFYSNIDNILPLLRLDLNNFKTKIDVIFLSINENLSYLLNGKSPQNVIYNEKYSLIENINILLNKFNLHFDNNQYNLNTDFSLIRNIQEKTITINTGTGCKGKCKYCNINDSKILYRSLDIIIEDIRTVLSLGIKYFHIINHNFACERDFVEKFCSKLIEIGTEYDFAWSCFIMPNFIINNLDLIELMTEAKLKRIEIGCESGNEKLLAKNGIYHSLMDVESIINSAMVAKIPNIVLHFMIGMPSETKKSLLETKEFIMRLLYLTTALCDIHLHCYFPEKLPINNKYEDICQKKREFIQGSKALSTLELSMYKKDMLKEINATKNELRKNIPVKTLYEQFELEHNYNIKTQTQKEFIRRTQRYMVFTIKNESFNTYYSWEIEENLDDYTPVFFTQKQYLPEEKLKSDLSNLNIVLINYILSGFSLGEIVSLLNQESSGKVNKQTIISILNVWEMNLELNYRKYLKI